MKTLKPIVFFAAVFWVASAGSSFATLIDQYADSVVDFSSQYLNPAWSASQALGAPDTLSYGDISTAWSPLNRNGSLEYITVGFAVPVYANGAVIRETNGNGFVYEIDARDTSGVYHNVWSGVDGSLAGTPVDFTVSWADTSYLVDALRIRTNTDHDETAWEEIDAITLRGDDTSSSSVPEGGTTFAMLGMALGSMVVMRRRMRFSNDISHSRGR